MEDRLLNSWNERDFNNCILKLKIIFEIFSEAGTWSISIYSSLMNNTSVYQVQVSKFAITSSSTAQTLTEPDE